MAIPSHKSFLNVRLAAPGHGPSSEKMMGLGPLDDHFMGRAGPRPII